MYGRIQGIIVWDTLSDKFDFQNCPPATISQTAKVYNHFPVSVSRIIDQESHGQSAFVGTTIGNVPVGDAYDQGIG